VPLRDDRNEKPQPAQVQSIPLTAPIVPHVAFCAKAVRVCAWLAAFHAKALAVAVMDNRELCLSSTGGAAGPARRAYARNVGTRTPWDRSPQVVASGVTCHRPLDQSLRTNPNLLTPRPCISRLEARPRILPYFQSSRHIDTRCSSMSSAERWRAVSIHLKDSRHRCRGSAIPRGRARSVQEVALDAEHDAINILVRDGVGAARPAHVVRLERCTKPI
jgi:hypothetical protein